MFTVLIFNFIYLCVFVNAEHPPGHLQPLGSHTPPILVDVLDKFPDPIDFFDNYVQRSKPVLFRGAAKQFPSFKNWQNDEYLKTKYGKWKVQAEEGKKENRSLGVQEMTYRKFLNVYNKSDIYLVQDVLPPNPMTNEVFLPKSLLCGGFTDYLSTAVMWFSSGGTKSVLHNDNFENINCLYDGSKELFMVDKKNHELVPIDVPDGGYCSVDVDKVDMYKYPTLGEVEWYLAKMEAGDCFYIPYSWYHQVKSSTSRNLAINIWWTMMYDLPKRQECEKELPGLAEFASLVNYKMADGFEQIRASLFYTFDEETRSATKQDFIVKVPYVIDGSELPTTRIAELFDLMDSDKDGVLTAVEVYAAKAEALKPILGEGPQDAFFDNEPPDAKDEL